MSLSFVYVVDIAPQLKQSLQMVEEEIYRVFGRSVSARRRQLGLTQARLAAQIGISRASIASIESGRQSVLLHHVYKLASALDFAKVSDLLPSLLKPTNREDIDMVLSDETLTPIEKSQISDLVLRALSQHSSKKGGM